MPSDRDYRERELGHLTASYRPKHGFETKAKAKLYIRRARGPIEKDNLKVYRCGICPNWHIGNSPRKEHR